MIRPGDRVVLTRAITTSGGFLRGPRVVVPAGTVGVVRTGPGFIAPPLVAFPTGGALVDFDVREFNLVEESKAMVMSR